VKIQKVIKETPVTQKPTQPWRPIKRDIMIIPTTENSKPN
jgi:hypothetical protein